MSKDSKPKVGYKKPPKATKFKKGVSGNPKGRPKKDKTFELELKEVFGAAQDVKINGEMQSFSLRQIILQQIARGAAKGDHRMIKMCLPFLKVMDDAPEFEALPEDKAALDDFLSKFNKNGSKK